MINFENSEYSEDYFPLLKFQNIFSGQFYNSLKTNFPDFSKYNLTSSNQKFRKNIVVSRNNQNERLLQELNIHFYKLWQYLNSSQFKTKILEIFTEKKLQAYGFKGDVIKLLPEMSICESSSSYENPWHIDKRKRFIQMLVYFGTDNIKSGGEIAIGKHKKLDSWIEYPQYPELSDLVETIKFPPSDNLGLIILSTPNSYHKGCELKGTRRFLYIALNHPGSDAWVNGWSRNSKPFEVGLKKEKQQNNNEDRNLHTS